MPSIAEVSPSHGSSGVNKRKRIQHGETDLHMKLTNSLSSNSRPLTPTSYTATRPLFETEAPIHLSHNEYPNFKPISLRNLRVHDTKRQRIYLPSLDQENEMQPVNPAHIGVEARSYLSPNSSASMDACVQSKSKTVDLSACHICHRKPSVKSDLDSYAYCESCEERTCYICIRQCGGYLESEFSPEALQGLFDIDKDRVGVAFSFQCMSDDERNGLEVMEDGDKGRAETWRATLEHQVLHKEMVCSRCCVERGEDGEVRCFGCLRTEGGG